jgi:sortase (surface protein transpeptidase)
MRSKRHHRLRPVVPLDVLGLVAALVAIVAFGFLGRSERPRAPQGPRLSRAQIAGAPERRPLAPSPAHRPQVRHRLQAPRPLRLRIPSIGVSARVVRLGLASNGTMETPSDYADVGWYAPGPEPGERGASVIAGHVDSKHGPAVFFRLSELRRGDQILVTVAGGKVMRFKVQGSERWAKASFPTRRVFARTPVPTLRLVTCSGAFDRATGHYLDNTIIYASRV